MWAQGSVRGTLDVIHGRLDEMTLAGARDRVRGNAFEAKGAEPCRLELRVAEARTAHGALSTRVQVRTESASFAFFLRDVDAAHPILIPEYGVAVTRAGDPRTYAEIAEAVRVKGAPSVQQRIDAEPEETFEAAAARNRDMKCPTWLGLGRDMRFFEVGVDEPMGYWGYVRPRYHSTLQRVPESDNKPYVLNFVVGRGAACRVEITRRLEEGGLPILRSVQREDDVHYHLTAFATLETQVLTPRAVRGSEWQACYPNTGGNMLSAEEREALKGVLDAEMWGREEETVCWLRVDAVNTGAVPRYAWFKALTSSCSGAQYPSTFEGATGFSRFGEAGRVFAIQRIDGRPMPQAEMAVLIPPGQTVTCDLLIPHQPLSAARAAKLAKQDFDEHREACRIFWRGKLDSAASIRVPEPAIDERIRAGLLHCDIAALGREPDGPVLATIGCYSPIGSESAPIIQFFDSMGWHSLAQRSIQFFLERQRPDGFIQNFGGYQLETGPLLWTMGEHYRYTRDDAWVRRVKPNVLKACDYLLAWRKRNLRGELRGKGYGLLDGRVADPEDFFHSFMLNGVSYLGIARAAEMLARVAPAVSRRLAGEAAAFRQDIRTAYAEALGRSPVVPLGDGTWAPAPPPWTEYPGPVSLFAEGGKWHTHGAFGSRDSLIGSLYLLLGEVLEPDETGATFLLRTHQELFTVSNAGLSQPYYCRHDLAHLQRGEVKAFLKTYYNQVTALQDRETYSFWEHYFHASQHKTHEEGWFLMQTRWMLWHEVDDTLHLLSAIPRRWMADGQDLALRQVSSYFGPVSLQVESRLDEGMIRAVVECRGARRPREVRLRLPHPEGRRPDAVAGGIYDASGETVILAPFKGKAEVTLRFGSTGG